MKHPTRQNSPHSSSHEELTDAGYLMLCIRRKAASANPLVIVFVRATMLYYQAAAHVTCGLKLAC